MSGDGSKLFLSTSSFAEIHVFFNGEPADGACNDDDNCGDSWNCCFKLDAISHIGETSWYFRQSDIMHYDNWDIPDNTLYKEDKNVEAQEQFGYALSASETGEFIAVTSRAPVTCAEGPDSVVDNGYGVVRVFKKRAGAPDSDGYFFGQDYAFNTPLNEQDTNDQLVFSKRIAGTAGMGLNVALYANDAAGTYLVGFTVYDITSDIIQGDVSIPADLKPNTDPLIPSNAGGFFLCFSTHQCLFRHGNADDKMGNVENGLLLQAGDRLLTLFVGVPKKGVVYGFIAGERLLHASTMTDNADGYGLAIIKTDDELNNEDEINHFMLATSDGTSLHKSRGFYPRTPPPPPPPPSPPRRPPPPPPPSSSSSDNTGAIIGGSVGGAAALGLIIFLLSKRRRGRSNDTPPGHVEMQRFL